MEDVGPTVRDGIERNGWRMPVRSSCVEAAAAAGGEAQLAAVNVANAVWLAGGLNLTVVARREVKIGMNWRWMGLDEMRCDAKRCEEMR